MKPAISTCQDGVSEVACTGATSNKSPELKPAKKPMQETIESSRQRLLADLASAVDVSMKQRRFPEPELRLPSVNNGEVVLRSHFDTKSKSAAGKQPFFMYLLRVINQRKFPSLSFQIAGTSDSTKTLAICQY
jgi:hypothetical protein